MQRNVKQKRAYTVAHSPEILQLALECLRKKQMSSYEAEKSFGIPRRTLLDKLKKNHSLKVGCPIRLRSEEENEIIKVLIAAADFGNPLSLLDLRCMVHKYLQKNGRDVFKGKMPGEKWSYGFLKRHRHKLSLRVTSNIKKARAEKTCNEMRQYFNNLKQSLLAVPKQNIMNYDETNLSDDPGKSKCIVKRGTKYPERILNHSKGCISIMFGATADGKMLPPYIVYKSKHMWTQWVTGGPPHARYNHSASGWFDANLFEDWFIHIVIPWANNLSGPKLIVGDNLASHLNPEIVSLCEQHNIRFVLLPANSTHLTQPLDVCVFGPLKRLWRKILTQFKIENPSEKALNKCRFPGLLTQVMDELSKRENNVISAFSATGIYPFNPETVLKRLPDYSEPSDYGVDRAVIDYLTEIRAPKIKEVQKRNKKVNILPGKSVSASDFQFTVNLDFKINSKKSNNSTESPKVVPNNKNVIVTSNILLKTPEKYNHCDESDSNIHQNIRKDYQEKTSKRKNTKKEEDSDEDDEDDYSVHDSSYDYEEEDNDKTDDEINIVPGDDKSDKTQNNVSEETPSEGSFLLVKFNLERGATKYFVGKVIALEDENNFKLAFLRHKGKGKFAWPINDDISIINKVDIEVVLPKPITQRRGILTFDVSKWCNYNIG
jgi:hypothetical protein